MSQKSVKVPDIGGSEDVEIIELLVKVGDRIEPEQSILVLESDKASMDIPAPAGGTITAIAVKVGDKVSEGDTILELKTDAKDENGGTGKEDTTSPGTDAGSQPSGQPAKKQAAREQAAEPAAASSKSGAAQTVEVKVPDIGGAENVDVIEVLVKAGDQITAEQSLITLETDKATMDVPSPQAGTVRSVQVSAGDKVSEGSPVLVLDVSGSETAAADDEPGDSARSGVDAAPAAPAGAPPLATEQGEAGEFLMRVPDIGGSEDVPIIEIAIKAGDQIREDDPVLTLESDKATMDIPAERGGKVLEVLVSVGGKVSKGDPVARLQVSGKATAVQQPSAAGAPSANTAPSATARGAESGGNRTSASAAGVPARPAAASKAAPNTSAAGTRSGGKVHAGPAVRKLAREFGVDLEQVSGSGPKARILKEDVQNFVKSGMQQLKAGAGTTGSGVFGVPQVKLPDFSQFGEVKRVPLSRVHRLTAENMTRSWLNVPHVTQFDQADITDMESFRKAEKATADKRGTRLTPLPFIIKACVRAMQALPQFNVALDLERDELIQKAYIHIGVAVDTPSGLMVPVIRDADKKGIWDIASELIDLADRARDRKLKSSELQGGCFSISSLGGIGGTAFTPIVNTPEVAILGLSRSSMQPVWRDGKFEPRLMLPLSLSYDHRAVNGADAARFTTIVAESLGDLRKLLL